MKAISGAYTASFSNTSVPLAPFGRSMQTSPIPIALRVCPSPVVITQLLRGQ